MLESTLEETLEGTWIPIAGELRGEKIPGESLKRIRLVMTGDGYVLEVNNTAVDRGIIKLFRDADPKAMEIIGAEGPNKGRSIPAIYELTADTLTICYNLEGESRPSEFKTEAGSQLYLVTYKHADA